MAVGAGGGPQPPAAQLLLQGPTAEFGMGLSASLKATVPARERAAVGGQVAERGLTIGLETAEEDGRTVSQKLRELS